MDVTAEIELLRVLNVRYLDSISDSLHQLDPDKQLADLRAFTLSARAVGALIRIQKARAAGEKDADETLEKYASLEVDEDEDIDTAS